MAVDPQVTVSLVFGTILAVVLFRGSLLTGNCSWYCLHGNAVSCIHKISTYVKRIKGGNEMTLSKGLENVYVAETSISSIIDDMLTYVGYGIDDLMENNASFEEVIYLLWHLRLPNKDEFKNLNEKSKKIWQCLKQSSQV